MNWKKDFEGRCFDAVGHLLFMYPELGNATICHGIGVSNKPGSLGKIIAHAWIELKDDLVIDPIELVKVEKDHYYKMLQLDFIVKYSYNDFLKKWTETNYPGPYDEKILGVCKGSV